MTAPLEAPEWYRALTLAERAALERTPGGSPPPAPADPGLARSRVARWRKEAGLEDDARFAERLALDGLDPERFTRLLVEEPESLRARCPETPPWLARLHRSFESPEPRPAMPLGMAKEAKNAGFLELLRPLLDDGWSRLRRRIRGLDAGGGLPCHPDLAAELLARKLPAQLLWMVSRPLVLELHVARLEERLEGATPETRFASFVETLRNRSTALGILREYPVLAREAVERIDRWLTAGVELIERLLGDRQAIAERFADGRDPGPMTDLESHLSDRHDGGRTVAIVTFASGLKVVYKPRPLALDHHFQELLGWLDERGAPPPFRRLVVLDRGDYGWVEHVAAAPCTDRAEVERFYHRQGAYLALLYALEGTDFHHENLVAAGEQPVLVDLETLFHPLPGGDGALHPAARTVFHSGLLPRRLEVGGGAPGLDLSGLGNRPGQVAEVPDLLDPATDRMRWGRRRETLAAGHHRPTAGDDAAASPWAMRGEILDGFRKSYRRLAEIRGELLAPGGPLAPFADVPTRFIVRSTASYARLIHASFHPDFLGDALARDRLFDRLGRNLRGLPARPRIHRAELDQLAAGDVPRFTARPGSRELVAGSGERIPGFFAAGGMELVRRRLADLDDDDLERQSWIVTAALETARPASERIAPERRELPEAPGTAEPGRLLDAARRIGDRLATLAVRNDEEVSWLHLDLDRHGSWQLESVGVDLYAGLPGIALFLAHLGARSGEERYSELARAAWRTARRRIERDPSSVRTVGAFSGWGGVLHALTHLGLLWGEPGWLEEAEARAAELPARIAEDAALDIVGGSAGCLASLLGLHRQRPAGTTLDAAVACGERLLASGERTERGLAWKIPDAGDVPLTGFAHGAAGGAWALLELAAVTGEDRYRDAALAAIAYERSWFDPERNNWPDLREDRAAGGERPYLHAWCHGAPGIGLARLATLPHLDDDEVRGEVRAAVGTTLEGGFGHGHCLCHGDLGNLELLRRAGTALDDPALHEAADHLAARVLADVDRDGWRCGANVGSELPGLMVGIAGIGYGLLRAAAPEEVPSVLLLEPPATPIPVAKVSKPDDAGASPPRHRVSYQRCVTPPQRAGPHSG